MKPQVTSVETKKRQPRHISSKCPQKSTPDAKKQSNTEDYDGIRFCGNPKLKSKNAREPLEHNTREVKTLLIFLQIDSIRTDLKRIRNFEKVKMKTVVIQLADEHQKELVVSSAR